MWQVWKNQLLSVSMDRDIRFWDSDSLRCLATVPFIGGFMLFVMARLSNVKVVNKYLLVPVLFTKVTLKLTPHNFL